METRENAATADIYKTDLERHMFAPPRRSQRRRRAPLIGHVGEWLRDWILSGWNRWRPLAGAAN